MKYWQKERTAFWLAQTQGLLWNLVLLAALVLLVAMALNELGGHRDVVMCVHQEPLVCTTVQR